MKSILVDSHWQETFNRIQRLTPDSKRQWGVMTCHQMIVHCTDQIRLAIGEKQGKPMNNWLLKTIVKRLILMGMPAPKGKVETLVELKQGALGTPPVDFETDRSKLIAIMREFRDSKFPPNPHPAFGEMNKQEWGKLIWTHLDHHFRQFSV